MRRSSVRVLKVHACFLALLTGFLVPAFGDGAHEQSPTEGKASARDAMAQVLDRYQNCITYRDEGVVKSSFLGEGPHDFEFKFSTRFRRNEFFLFRSEPPVPCTVKLSDGVLRRESLGEREREKEDGDLPAALREISHETNGASTNIPLLLFGDGMLVAALKHPTRWTQLEGGSENGKSYSRYAFSTVSWVYEFRVDHKSMCILQITKTSKGGLENKVQVRYKPEIEGSVVRGSDRGRQKPAKGTEVVEPAAKEDATEVND